MSESFPKAFDYNDYRIFLSDIVAAPQKYKGLSLRKIAELASFKNPVFISRVIQRNTSLTPQSARKLGHRFGMKSLEIEYLCLLVAFNDAKTEKVKQSAHDDLLTLSKRIQSRTLIESEAQYFMIPALFELIGLEPYCLKSEKEIAETLGLPVSRVRDAFDCLRHLGLIEESVIGWKKKAESLQTPPEFQSLALRELQLTMIEKAKASLQQDPPEVRGFYALTLGLSAPEIQTLKERLFKFCQDQLLEYQESTAESDQVFQLNINFFPLLRPVMTRS